MRTMVCMGPWQSQEEMHSYLQCNTKWTSLVSSHAYLNKKKTPCIIISMPRPPNSFHYVWKKTFIVILMIELSKKVFNNLVTQVDTNNDETSPSSH